MQVLCAHIAVCNAVTQSFDGKYSADFWSGGIVFVDRLFIPGIVVILVRKVKARIVKVRLVKVRSSESLLPALLSVSFGISVIRERSLQRLQCSDISPVDVLVAGMSMVKSDAPIVSECIYNLLRREYQRIQSSEILR